VLDGEGDEEGGEEGDNIGIIDDAELVAINNRASDADIDNESVAEGVGEVSSRPFSTNSFSTPGTCVAAARLAAASLSSQKTKNSTNKNKERTSISGAIVKLVENMKGDNDKSDMNTRMNFMMMCQMERMEKRERCRDRKRREKRRTKKAKMKALEALPDHGGKMGPSEFNVDSSSSGSSISSK